MPPTKFFPKYAEALAPLIQRPIGRYDGLASATIEAAERELGLKIPAALREYYLAAGRLPLNKEHNRLRDPAELSLLEGKLVFMEENQVVVFWGTDERACDQDDPEVFQANNEVPIVWYSEQISLSDFIIKMWRWQYGLDPGL